MEKERCTYHIVSRYWIVVIVFVTNFFILKSFTCLFCRNKLGVQIPFKFYGEGTLIVFTTKYVTSARYKSKVILLTSVPKKDCISYKNDIVSQAFQAHVMPTAT